MERRFSSLEFRAEGRNVGGVVMRYGEVSPSHKERFEPGSLRLADVIHLDLGHDRERVVAWRPDGGLELVDGDASLELTAELPPIPAADRALDEIRAGKVTGLSVEFQAVRERKEAGVRVIEEALLNGIGLVRAASYGSSQIELRGRRLLWLL